jgi:hypothetical protein
MLTSTNNPGTVAAFRVDTHALILALNGAVSGRATNVLGPGRTNIITAIAEAVQEVIDWLNTRQRAMVHAKRDTTIPMISERAKLK